MKHQILLSLVAGCLVFTSCDNKPAETSSGDTQRSEASDHGHDHDHEAMPKKYPIKAGIITFETLIEVAGNHIDEKKVLYFDDYGMKEAEETYEADVLTKTFMSDGEFFYNLIHAEKSAYKGQKAHRGIAYKFDWNEISQSDKDSGKVKKVANETVAEKDCEAYVMETGGTKTKFAGWNNITLLTEQEGQGMKSVTRAVKIEEVQPPAEKLIVPADYNVKDK